MKNSLRKEYLRIRNSLAAEDVLRLSDKIYTNLKKIPEYLNAENYMVYIDFKNEVSTNKIILDILKRNRNVYIPISKPETYELIVSKLEDISDLEPSTYGILEPKKEKLIAVSPEIIDFVIVPGVVFDREGYRIGYGKGYYDRFLSVLKQKPTTIGICYDFQLVHNIHRDIYDYKLDYIVTNNEVLKIMENK